MAKPVAVDDKTFEEQVLKAPLPTVVDFWAAWCGPCRLVAPVVEELATDYEGKVGFAKLNVDENPAIAGRFAIRSIPTLILFKGGKPVKQWTGYRPKAELQKLLEEALAK